MIKFFGRRQPQVDPKDLVRQADEINEKLERDQQKMNALATFLERRRLQNGFGTDFEYTLRPKES